MIKFVDLSVGPLEREQLSKCLEDLLAKGDFILGSSVEQFESRIADYCQTRFALGLNSGTDALMLALKAFGIKPGDEVITAPNSFIATAGAIVACSAKPVFVDVGQDYLIDPEKIEAAITSKTKAIIPVHLTGRMAEMDAINAIARKYNLAVIEDAAQAIGAEYNGVRAGGLGDAGCFSLHPLKILNVLGDGGVLTTNNPEVYETIKQLRNHGLKNRNEADSFGLNSRLDTLQAAFALLRLEHLEEHIEARIKNADIYRKKLQGVQLPAPTRRNSRDTYNTFIVQSKQREGLQKFLYEHQIGSAVHYPIPIHLQQAAKSLGYKNGDFPNTEEQAGKILSLPVHQGLSQKDIEYVCEIVNKF